MAFNQAEREKFLEDIKNDIVEDAKARIKLLGSYKIPQTESEVEGYYLGRVELIAQGEPTWVARNFDTDSNGMVWDYIAPGKDGLRILMTDDFVQYEGCVGKEGEIGSGLTSLCAAVQFVEEFDISTRT